jgi:predicted amidophosphoribosyltransferase
MSGLSGWDGNFPKVMHFVDPKNCCAKPWRLLQNHPDYDAAKNHEDRAAALRLVQDLLSTPENKAQMKFLKDTYPGAVIASVHAIEAAGKNRIPQMLAEYIAKKTGLDAGDTIVQTNQVFRTASDAWYRFAFRPEFDGPVKKGGTYILVDDVFAFGGSFSELRRHIERNGGKVVQTAAMALGGHGDEIALSPAMRARLLDTCGEKPLSSFLKEFNLYDGNYRSLTQPEAYVLVKTPSLDEARNRIIAARQTGRPRNSQEAAQGRKAPGLDPLKPAHRQPRRR